MGKPRMLGYNKLFTPNRYADMRRRPGKRKIEKEVKPPKTYEGVRKWKHLIT